MFQNTKINKIIMFKNTNSIITIMFVNTNCIILHGNLAKSCFFCFFAISNH